MTGRGGPIPVVEACYDLAASEDAWLLKIADAMYPLIGEPKHGLIGYHVSFSQNRSIRITNPVQAQGREDVRARIQSMSDLLERRNEGRASLLESVQAKVYEAVIRGGLRTPADQMLMSEIDKVGPDWMYTLGVPGVRDHFFLISHHVDGHGATLLVAGLTQRGGLSSAERRMHQMLSAHIKAGLRLRRRLGGRTLGVAAPRGGAVLDAASGAVVHAEDDACDAESRSELQDAARHIDRARCRDEDGHNALEVWRGLVRGRWSLVEQVDADGRRYMLAHKNPEDVVDPRGLTNMESRVIGLAVRGYSNKVIAYHLGISEGTTATHLHAAMSKLKIEGRVELVRLLGSHYPQPTDPRFDD
jgi:DNA-binding CsgD family transcriptional regulator